jgi:hypothetical protein
MIINYLPRNDSRLTSSVDSTSKGRGDTHNVCLSRDSRDSKGEDGSNREFHFLLYNWLKKEEKIKERKRKMAFYTKTT